MTTSSSRITVHCIGNAHIDPVWRWPWQEGYTETLATCRAAVDRLRESNDFVFSRGQAATYAWIEEAEPELFAEIQKYVREGRWNIVNGWWEQPDCNIPCGESYVRHALYGKRYFREKFGVDVTTGWNPDTFGHNLGLPQILARSGFKTYCFFRPGGHEKDLPGPYFWWEGADGSRVLAIRPPVGHYCTGGGSMAEEIRRSAEAAKALGLEHSILFYGVGNHGGGPTQENIASIRALHENSEEPDAIFSTVEAFMEAIADKSDGFPTVTEDLQHHAPGCYTTHSEIKRLNRLAENRLMRAEKWCALAAWELGRPYPKAEFAHAWKQLLFNQFHDILAGTSLPAAYTDAAEQISESLSIAARLQNTALQALAAKADTTIDETEPPAAAQGRPIVLFNSASWVRTDIATVQWGWGGEWGTKEDNQGRLVDDNGVEVPFQFTQPDIFGGGTRIHFEATVPAHGFRVYRLLPGSPSTSPETPVPESLDHIPDQALKQAMEQNPIIPAQAGANWLENRYFRIEFDTTTGTISRLYDKWNEVEVLAGPGCALLVMNDPGDTWGHDIASWREEIGRFSEANITVVENGPVRATLRVETRWQNSTAIQEFTLYRGTSRIDVTLTLDWHEKHQMVKLSVPVAIPTPYLHCEAAYSKIQRKPDGKEDPCQSWIEIGGKTQKASGEWDNYSLVLLNDSKYGYDCLANDLRLSLLRSPIYCFHDPAKVEEGREYLYMDQGVQTIRYALLPSTAAPALRAYEFNNPFEYVFQYPHTGEWGRQKGFLPSWGAEIVAMKMSEDGDDLILRLYCYGMAGGLAQIAYPNDIMIEGILKPGELRTLRINRNGEVREVNLLEE